MMIQQYGDTRDEVLDLAYTAGWQLAQQEDKTETPEAISDLDTALDISGLDPDDWDLIEQSFGAGVREGMVWKHRRDITLSAVSAIGSESDN